MRQRQHSLFVIVGTAAVVLMLSSLAACGGSSGGTPGLDGPWPGFGSGADGFVIVDRTWIGEDRRPVVEYRLELDGAPLSVEDLDGEPRWTMAWIHVLDDTGYTRYLNYTILDVTGKPYEDGDDVVQQPALASATQASTDAGGTLEMLATGSYRYTFDTVLPLGFDASATHTLGGQATMNGRTEVSNPIVHFVPNGRDVTVLREVVSDDACNACHTDLRFHGGSRRGQIYCQLCHTEQSIDPESGNTVEYLEMIHKIHRGHDLTDLPYFVVGYMQSFHDYSEVVFPTDVRACVICHQGVPEADNWRLAPAQTSCGSCHDAVDWDTGAGHAAGVQPDESCATCHRSVATTQFDLSVPGAHVVPYYSNANRRLTLTILDVGNLEPGFTPAILFVVEDDLGDVDIATLDRVAVALMGPVAESESDYTSLLETFTIQGFGSSGILTEEGPGLYLYSPTPYTVPLDARGTWAVGMEARTTAVIVKGESINFGANNPVVYIDTDTGFLGVGNPDPRRQIISDQSCDSCHGDLRFHGNLRTEAEYCTVCHARWVTDEARRPAPDLPPESVDLGYLIHKIHRGSRLENDFTVWGFGPTEHNYNHLIFPGDLSKCSQCHIGETWKLPIPEVAEATVFNVGGMTVNEPGSIRPPTTAVCTSCHDGDSSLAHALQNVVPAPITEPYMWVEACITCHGPGRLYDADQYHTGD